MIKIQFEKDSEIDLIREVHEKNGYMLYEIQYIINGNFLIFGIPSDEILLEQRVANLELTANEELSNYILDVDMRLLMLEMGL